jgi:hypothetical protein
MFRVIAYSLPIIAFLVVCGPFIGGAVFGTVVVGGLFVVVLVAGRR